MNRGSKKRLEKMKKFLEMNNNNITYQNLWNTAKVVLRRQYITIIAFIKLEKYKICASQRLIKQVKSQVSQKK